MRKTKAVQDHQKLNGVHYTPPELAEFLAAAVIRNLDDFAGDIKVLDPACGDGALLKAVANAASSSQRRRLQLYGFDLDPLAIAAARDGLAKIKVKSISLESADFLHLCSNEDLLPGFAEECNLPKFNVVIANPPYVRTQVLGAGTSQSLSKRFGIDGRVDLFQAFSFAMHSVLTQGGVFGLLTSNRLLTTNASASLRSLFRLNYKINELYDLGDTKLFSAAVLPAVIIAKKSKESLSTNCHFARVYESREDEGHEIVKFHVLDCLRKDNIIGRVQTPEGRFLIEKGTLAEASNREDKWSLSTPEFDYLLSAINDRKLCSFEDVATIKVGIKTTADKVFVKSDWDDCGSKVETHLLRHLLTHREANRWRSVANSKQKQVLYPYEIACSKKTPVDLSDYKGAQEYLEKHKQQLQGREYLIEAGRKWYEIWVPHVPSEWALPKIVFPDISEEPKFFLDLSGAIVQGDCYWMMLKKGVCEDFLYLMLAVANSSLGTKFYDVMFHNKLYAGRRRFMTQYVRKFPIPKLEKDKKDKLVQQVKQLVNASGDLAKVEADCDSLVWEAFGLRKEI
jgi:adenine-specific DNA-methyltransferase